MSLYAEYLKEKTDDQIIESEIGFATYCFLNSSQVYIKDIYIKPAYRVKGAASAIADIIVDKAKQQGCLELIGTVIPSTKNSTDSLKTLLAYGMKLKSASENMIVFEKGI